MTGTLNLATIVLLILIILISILAHYILNSEHIFIFRLIGDFKIIWYFIYFSGQIYYCCITPVILILWIIFTTFLISHMTIIELNILHLADNLDCISSQYQKNTKDRLKNTLTHYFSINR